MNDKRFETGIKGVTPDELPDKLRAAIKDVEKHFPKGTGIAVFTFDLNQTGAGGFGWIANGDRGDMIDALVEFIQRQRGTN